MQGSDPDLSEEGIEQAKRLPDALARFPITRLVSSPQRRALQTAQPVADALGLAIDIDERLAEYDYDLVALHADRGGLRERTCSGSSSGHLPGAVDEDAFIARVNDGIDDIVATADHDDTVAVFSHGGVINATGAHASCRPSGCCASRSTTRASPGCCPRATGNLGVASVNGTEHVWDLLPRNQRW